MAPEIVTMSEPIHILSLGAGVQSSTMAFMAAHGEITPMPKCAIFADTQDEPQSVYTWLDWLEKQLPFPVHRVTKGKLSEDITRIHQRKDGKGQYQMGGIPAFTIDRRDGHYGIMPRQCTMNFKVKVLEKEVKRVAGITKGQKTIGVIQWIGISLDEVHRMKQPKWKWHDFRYPLIDLRMKRHDCLCWMQSHDYPKPPRSACRYCPYHSNAEWRRLRDEEPDEFAAAVAMDYEFRRTKALSTSPTSIPFLHSSRVPLDKVDFSTDEDHGQQVMFGNDCDGLCGV
jgi:hypothetical protein